MSALNTMLRSDVAVSGDVSGANGESVAKIVLTNRSNRVAFFLRAEVTKGSDGEEVVPITYDDNYMTVFPHEVRTIVAKFATSALGSAPGALRIEGYNTPKKVAPLSR